MKNSKYLIDDVVLATLLRKANSNQMVWQLTYERFYTVFKDTTKDDKGLDENQMQIFFRKALSTLINKLDEANFEINQPLFATLIKEGCNIDKCFFSKNQMNIAAPFLAGEILVQLMLAKDAECFYHLFTQYKEPTMSILNHKYDRYFNVSPEEIYGEAMMILRSNIEKGKLKAPMKSRLFTYFFLIARNKYLALGNGMKGISFYSDLKDFESVSNPTISESSFDNYAIESLCPTLKGILDSSNEEFFKKLLNTFHSEEHELLRLRFEEGLRFKEIGKRMSLKESTCRKRLHDSIKKWKK